MPIRALFVAATLVIIYVTTAPWEFGHAPDLSRVAWIPFWDAACGRPPPAWDLVGNVVLFVPFGLCGVLAGVRQGRGRPRAVARIACAALALSCTVEALQTLSPSRVPSLSDVLTNVAGALVGGALARVYLARRAAPGTRGQRRRRVCDPG